jgi:hypothetical protein
MGDMTGDQAADGCGDAEWSKFRFIEGVFVEAEEVDVGEVAFNGRGKLVFVDLVKDKV